MPDRFWAWVDKKGPDECWEWKGFLPDRKWSYGAFSINNKKHPAHRVAFELHHARKVADGLFVCHSCDNPPCCNPRHLFEGTQKANLEDMDSKGRRVNGRSALGKFGDSSPNCRLSNEQAERIRIMYNTGKHHQKTLAKLFGVAQGTIHNVVHGKHYPNKSYVADKFRFITFRRSQHIKNARSA